MAVNPLYTAVKSDFLDKIRLSSATNDETLAVIDVAISKVRLGFFSSLTSDRAIEIAGFADSDNPTTEEEVLKAIEEGYTDLEELRKKLRIGMGPCQGRVCIQIVIKRAVDFCPR